jgi:hypothetical protein
VANFILVPFSPINSISFRHYVIQQPDKKSVLIIFNKPFYLLQSEKIRKCPVPSMPCFIGFSGRKALKNPGKAGVYQFTCLLIFQNSNAGLPAEQLPVPRDDRTRY